MDIYRMTIAYDGLDYHGWQRQPDKKTIQGLIDKQPGKGLAGMIGFVHHKATKGVLVELAQKV